jgi:hypothetical protein
MRLITWCIFVQNQGICSNILSRAICTVPYTVFKHCLWRVERYVSSVLNHLSYNLMALWRLMVKSDDSIEIHQLP